MTHQNYVSALKHNCSVTDSMQMRYAIQIPLDEIRHAVADIISHCNHGNENN